MASFYKKVGKSYVVDLKKGQEVRYFIPENWFSSNIVFAVGEYYNLLGVFSYALYDEKDKMIGELHQFNYPTAFLAEPYKIDTAKDLVLGKYGHPEDYRVLRFRPGDKLIVEDQVPQSIETVEDLFRLWVITGHIPNTIPYTELHEYLLENVKYSGNKYKGVPIQMIGIMVTKMARDINDPSKPFRLSPEKKKKIWNAYSSCPIVDVPKYISTYAAFTSVNFDDSIIAACEIEKENHSPLERVLMGPPNSISDGAEE